LNNASAYDYVQALYRFTFVLSGSGSFAYQEVERTLQEAYLSADKQLERVRFQTLFSNVIASAQTVQAEPDLPIALIPLHRLADPDRAALTLFYLEILTPRQIAEITSTSIDELADRVGHARAGLGYFRSASDPLLFPLLRLAYGSTSELVELHAAVEAEPQLKSELVRQTEFDNHFVDELRRIELTEAETDQIERMLAGDSDADDWTDSDITQMPNASPSPGSTSPDPEPSADSPKSTITPATAIPSEQPSPEVEEEAEAEAESKPRTRAILFAVGIGLIATIAMVAWIFAEQSNEFTGSEKVVSLLDAAASLTGDEFEPVSTSVGSLKDWFFLKHVEHFAIPKAFTNLNAIGCRVVKFNGANVGEIMAKGDRPLLLYVFSPSDMGVNIRRDHWHIVDGASWVGGVTGVEDACFIVSFRGNNGEMQEFLKDKK
jgi:hypothetical protein